MTRRPLTRLWTTEDDANLRRMWAAGLRLDQIARVLRRSKSAVKTRTANLDLSRRKAANASDLSNKGNRRCASVDLPARHPIRPAEGNGPAQGPLALPHRVTIVA
jgi:hypothetical protein